MIRERSNREPAPLLIGRDDECAALDHLLESVLGGQTRVLVVRGEPGIGRSVLLEHLAQRATGCRVARASGVESEMGLPFAGLHQLCAPMVDALEGIPGHQRDALASALGIGGEPCPDRFVVGLAVLSLLCSVASSQPLICVVDDAQWLDDPSALALGFAARRLRTGSIGLVLALDGAERLRDFSGLPEIVVGGLRDDDVRSLLDASLTGRIEERVRDRIVAESNGNPRTVLELARGLAPTEMAGGFAVPEAMPRMNGHTAWFTDALESLPTKTRRLLLIAAAEPLGDVGLLWRAAGLVGIGPDALPPARAAGLLDIGTFVRFSQPHLRTAIYRDASQSDRVEAHRALAEATDPTLDPERRAWHRASAARGPDEHLAAELERLAESAAAYGGAAAAAAFLKKAAELTPSPHRARRLLDAADGKVLAGAFDEAAEMLAIAERGPVSDDLRARLDLSRARLMLARGQVDEAARVLANAAPAFKPVDGALAHEAHLEALSAAALAGHRANGGAATVIRAVRDAPPGRPPDNAPRCLWLACAAAADRWDYEQWWELSAAHVDVVRQTGALSELPLALNWLALAHLFAGELTQAASLSDQAITVSDLTGCRPAPFGAAAVAGWRGHDAEARMPMETDSGLALSIARWAAAVRLNARGDYVEAVISANEASMHPAELAVTSWGLVELVEAGVRSDQRALATDALERLIQMTSASETAWARGVEARSRALLCDGETANRLYREAVEWLNQTKLHADCARAHLLYGEWLRRNGRRVAARQQLGEAHDTFVAIGMEAFAERTQRELAATGAKARKRDVACRDDLTPQELQIARLACRGLSNPEIGAKLFLSPRTVEWHLRKVFAKLGIRSRRQLDTALPPLE